MNTQLKEKIQKQALEHATPQIVLNKFNQAQLYITGAEAMYAELAPLVEWVSVEDNLPEENELVLAKFSKEYHNIPETVRFAFGKFYHTISDDVTPFFPRIGIDITHWRRIEL